MRHLWLIFGACNEMRNFVVDSPFANAIAIAIAVSIEFVVAGIKQTILSKCSAPYTTSFVSLSFGNSTDLLSFNLSLVSSN